MFTNLEELKELIIQGKTNEEIIEGRLRWLRSKQYKEGRIKTVNSPGCNVVEFHDGFIDENEVIGFEINGTIEEKLYKMDDVEIYNDIIDFVRNNMDMKGFTLGYMINKVRDYYKIDDNSQYKELVEYFNEQLPNNNNFLRRHFHYIIEEYESSSFNGTITEFGKGYLCYLFKEKNGEQQQLADKYYNSLDQKKLKEEKYATVLPISALKGAGIAECTEYSMLMQNCFAFLGFEVYLIGGKVQKENGEVEAHNFNVIKGTNGTYRIVDAAMASGIIIDNVTRPEELMNLDGVQGVNGYKEQLKYFSGPKRQQGTTKTR